MQDIYRLRKIVKQEETTRSMSGDDYEHSEGSPIKQEDEEPTIQPEEASETGSTTEVDEGLDVLDEPSDGYADLGILTPPPPPGTAIPHLYTAGAAAGMEFATSPVVPPTSMEPTVSPASSMAPAISPVQPTVSMESPALPIAPATQPNYIAPPLPPPPPVHLTYDMPPQGHIPPPLVVYIPYPPYQMTLYPLYPLYLPPPTR